MCIRNVDPCGSGHLLIFRSTSWNTYYLNPIEHCMQSKRGATRLLDQVRMVKVLKCVITSQQPRKFRDCSHIRAPISGYIKCSIPSDSNNQSMYVCEQQRPLKTINVTDPLLDTKTLFRCKITYNKQNQLFKLNPTPKK